MSDFINAKVDKETWKRERIALLEDEKALSKASMAVAAKRSKLPWCESDDYELTDSSGSKSKLSELFQSDSNELLVYHLMYGEDYNNACSMCCFFIDQFNGALSHLIAHGAKLVVVANKESSALEKLKAEKGWEMQLLSCKDTTFGEDHGVSFTSEQCASKECEYNFNRKWLYGKEAPGLSVFRRQDGKVYRTYSTYAAGLGDLSLVHSLCDLTTTGRDEKGKSNMWWVKHKEDYNK
jgi:predicted dithiol-disulfide oxidoreductase (DUF899 family)